MGRFWGSAGSAEGPEVRQRTLERLARAFRAGGPDAPATGTGAAWIAADPAPNGTAHVGRAGGFLGAVAGRVELDLPPAASIPAGDGIVAALIAGYRDHGAEVMRHVGGSFALALVSDDGRRAFLAIDRLGGRVPLHYAVAGEQLIFSTDGRVLRAHPAVPSDLDEQAIFDYLYLGHVPSPRTALRGASQLLPGTSLELSEGRLRQRTYWRPEYDDDAPGSVEELCEEFLALIRSCVARDVGAETRRGCFLSGGTDSSTIAGLLAEGGPRRAETFSIGFEAEGYDEMEYARCAVRHFGTEHHEYYVTPDDVLATIPMVAEAYDAPFGNASAVPVFHCARIAREHGMRRLLAGDGGDELFAGNQRYATQHVFGYYERVPPLLRAAVLEPLAFGLPGAGRIPPLRKLGSYIRQARLPMPDRMESYNHLERAGIQRVIEPEFLARVDPEAPLRAARETYRSAAARTMLNRMLALDLKITLTDSDLPKVSRMCELAGVEVAYPFLRDEMVDFSLRVPARLKLRGLKLRWFMKHALRDYLPREILAKKKHGFGLPFGIWMARHPGLRAFAEESLRGLKSREIVRGEYLDELLRLHASSHATYYGVMIWTLTLLEQWFRARERDGI